MAIFFVFHAIAIGTGCDIERVHMRCRHGKEFALIYSSMIRSLTRAIAAFAAGLLAISTTSCQSQKSDFEKPDATLIGQLIGPGGNTRSQAVNNSGQMTSNPRYPRGNNPQVNLPSGTGGQQVSFSRVNTSSPYIAITFDDGPHPLHTPRLLDMLRERNISATFYVVGTNTRAHPHLIRRMIAEGHEIGNHTWNHQNLTKISEGAVIKQLEDTKSAIVSACGVSPRTMRPPYGALTTSQRQMIKARFGYPTILWDVDPEDWKRPGSSVVANRIVSNTRGGSIVLAHDIHQGTIDAMPAALDGLLAKGYTFVTVSQLLSQAN